MIERTAVIMLIIFLIIFPLRLFRVIYVIRSCVWAVGVADCRWQSFCDLTESADESPPLQDWRHTFRLVVGDGVPDIPMWFYRIRCISHSRRGAPVWAPVRCSINCAVNRIILIFHTKLSKFLQYFQKRSCQNIKVVLYLKLPNIF